MYRLLLVSVLFVVGLPLAQADCADWPAGYDGSLGGSGSGVTILLGRITPCMPDVDPLYDVEQARTWMSYSADGNISIGFSSQQFFLGQWHTVTNTCYLSKNDENAFYNEAHFEYAKQYVLQGFNHWTEFYVTKDALDPDGPLVCADISSNFQNYK